MMDDHQRDILTLYLLPNRTQNKNQLVNYIKEDKMNLLQLQQGNEYIKVKASAHL